MDSIKTHWIADKIPTRQSSFISETCHTYRSIPNYETELRHCQLLWSSSTVRTLQMRRNLAESIVTLHGNMASGTINTVHFAQGSLTSGIDKWKRRRRKQKVMNVHMHDSEFLSSWQLCFTVITEKSWSRTQTMPSPCEDNMNDVKITTYYRPYEHNNLKSIWWYIKDYTFLLCRPPMMATPSQTVRCSRKPDKSLLPVEGRLDSIDQQRTTSNSRYLQSLDRDSNPSRDVRHKKPSRILSSHKTFYSRRKSKSAAVDGRGGVG